MNNYLLLYSQTLIWSFLIFQQADHNKGLFNLILFSIIFVLQVFLHFRFQKTVKGKKTIQVKSSDWMYAVGISVFVLFIFYVEGFSIPNVIASVLMLASMIFEYKKSSVVHYVCSEEGIKNLNTDKMIPANIITGIRTTDKGLAIDTKKYINDLVLPHNKLIKPSDEKLIALLKAYEKTWG